MNTLHHLQYTKYVLTQVWFLDCCMCRCVCACMSVGVCVSGFTKETVLKPCSVCVYVCFPNHFAVLSRVSLSLCELHNDEEVHSKRKAHSKRTLTHTHTHTHSKTHMYPLFLSLLFCFSLSCSCILTHLLFSIILYLSLSCLRGKVYSYS